MSWLITLVQLGDEDRVPMKGASIMVQWDARSCFQLYFTVVEHCIIGPPLTCPLG